MKNTIILFFVAASLFSAQTLRAQVLASDSLALVDLYNATDGANWSHSENWLSGPVPTWFGITVDNKRVTKIDPCFNCTFSTDGNNIKGFIPSSIGNLTELTTLVMAGNSFTGSIPVEIGNLTKLERLDLTLNGLSGTIPASIGNLTSLRSIMLAANNLTGELPKEIGQLTLLDNLSAASNKLSGVLPVELGNCTSLGLIQMSGNQFTGSIPKEIGNLSLLRMVSLENNQFTGEIPTEIGNLTEMYALYLQNNQLTGSIPKEIGNLTNLRTLYLNDNKLNGSIPKEIGQLSVLSTFVAYNNQLTGAIPEEIGNLTELSWISLYRNSLTGNIPSSIGNCTKLTTFSLSNNQLSGSMPATLGNLTSLTSFDVGSNQLTGSIPASLANLTLSRYFIFENNEFTGALPAGFSNLPELEYLSLYNNQLTDLPVLTGNAKLTHLLLQNNRFTFEDLEANVDVPGTTYLPQTATFGAPDQHLTEGDRFTTGISIGGALNQYQWWKNGFIVANGGQSKLTIDSVKVSDAGSYELVITNSKVAGLFFTSDPIVLQVDKKPDPIVPDPPVEDPDPIIPDPPVKDPDPIIHEPDSVRSDPTPIIIEKRTYELIMNSMELLSGNGVEFDLTEVGNERTHVLELVNTGNTLLSISDIRIEGPFSLMDNGQTSLSPSETMELRIAFNPDHIGEHTGSVTIYTDSDTPELTLDLKGEGEADIEVYNVVTTNQNDKNDFLTIKNIALFPGNNVQIFDRWGNVVYSATDYNNIDKAFSGLNTRGNVVAEGTYFYVIDKNNGSKAVTGFILVRN